MTELKTDDFDYYLPKELIAQTPIEPRDHSRLLVFNRNSGAYLHKHFFDLPELLNEGDMLVLNNTRVMPARLFGKKMDDDGSIRADAANIEVLLLKRKSICMFEVLLRPAKRLRTGQMIFFSKGLRARVCEVLSDGNRLIEFKFDGILEQELEKVGQMPLPHYIHEKLKDNERYQTVYNKISGSAAAPTAGLHFTKELLEALSKRGVQLEYLTLDVGLGTFRPVSAKTLAEHRMHSEHFSIDEAKAKAINKAKAENRRVIAVGTTSVRALESASTDEGIIEPMEKDTDIFIYPGYNFKVVDGIITNFHLPKSTLIMLISAFLGRETTLKLYQEAISSKYRFFSFGDATMLL